MPLDWAAPSRLDWPIENGAIQPTSEPGTIWGFYTGAIGIDDFDAMMLISLASAPLLSLPRRGEPDRPTAID